MTPYEVVLILYFLMWYFLVALAVFFVLSGLDDLFIDVYYWVYYLIRSWRYRNFPPLTYQKLIEKSEQKIAVLVPCWNEANVIGTMLQHNCNAIDYHRYDIFVGVYPNDPETVKQVQAIEKINPHVKCIINGNPGPTNKAENLNMVYQRIRQLEQTTGELYDIFVFHDSEDIIHPRSFLLYNYLIPRKDMIQIPVFPLAVPYFNFTHWLYADEFSENHTKDIIVREAIHGHVPSAGVGTAFSRKALAAIENPDTKMPFSDTSLTEDYRTSLAIRIKNLKQIFVSQRVVRLVWQQKGWLRKRYVKKQVKEFVATRALFPMTYRKSVRQKARWIIGIVFQEWKDTQWPEQWIIRYTLAHDRKSFITHFINGFGYFVFFFWLIYAYLTHDNPIYPSLQEQLNVHPWVWYLIIAVTLLMLQRMIQRIIAIQRVYSILPAILSIPRVFYGNVLNFHALCRAYRIYFGTEKKSRGKSSQPKWDKTEHQFPAPHILTDVKKRLGDLLLENGLVSKAQLQKVMIEQQQSGERLGVLLCKHNLITEAQLTDYLSRQFQLGIFPKTRLANALNTTRQTLPNRMTRWLVRNKIYPVHHGIESQAITLAIEDPTNEYIIEKAINYVEPYKAVFVLIDNNQ